MRVYIYVYINMYIYIYVFSRNRKFKTVFISPSRMTDPHRLAWLKTKTKTWY